MRLLIADDTEIVRRAVAGVIVDCCQGVNVVGEAKSEGELMRMIEALKPDIVLADLNMPSDTPLAPEIFKAHLGSVCLLVMSAWFDEPSKARARAYGAVELLDKSKLVDTLQPAIERCKGPARRAAV